MMLGMLSRHIQRSAGLEYSTVQYGDTQPLYSNQSSAAIQSSTSKVVNAGYEI